MGGKRKTESLVKVTGIRINVFDFKNTNSFKYSDITLFANGIKKYLFNPRQPLDDLVSKAKARLRQARYRLSQRWKVKIYCIRGNAGKPTTPTKNIMDVLKGSFPRITDCHFLDTEYLINEYLDLKSKQNIYSWPITVVSGDISDDPEDKIIVRNSRNKEEINAMFVRLKLTDVVKLQKAFTVKGFDLFDANVRDFQKKKGLSQKILHSVRNHPTSFHIFHNGLTFSCSSIEKENADKYYINRPQIINGCQTVSTLYDTYKNKVHAINLKHATILCRFYVLKGTMIEKVCEATNTQIKISLWDLRANDAVQKLLEKLLALNSISYKRKKGGSARNGVSITELAQWICSCRLKKPAYAKDKKISYSISCSRARLIEQFLQKELV